MKKNNKKQKGFTLLLAALVASITLSLGAAIYSITLKQITLSGIGRDSQFAFYAADTLSECALYWDVRRGIFSTTTPPASITCAGVTLPVTAVNNTSSSAGGTNSIAAIGTTNTTLAALGAPATYGTLTVTVYGGGGGGGGGGTNLSAGCNGGQTTGPPCSGSSNGGATSFNGTVLANVGGAAQGGRTSGAAGTNGTGGTASGGNFSNSQGTGPAGGGGGPGASGGGNGGVGGAGGVAVSTFTPGTLSNGDPITVVVGIGGTGGNKGGGTASNGFNGNSGRVDFSWTGTTATWVSTNFSFSADLNNDCAAAILTKALVGGSISTTISSNGLNVACANQLIDPRALQRSVQLKY